MIETAILNSNKVCQFLLFDCSILCHSIGQFLLLDEGN